MNDLPVAETGVDLHGLLAVEAPQRAVEREGSGRVDVEIRRPGGQQHRGMETRGVVDRLQSRVAAHEHLAIQRIGQSRRRVGPGQTDDAGELRGTGAGPVEPGPVETQHRGGPGPRGMPHDGDAGGIAAVRGRVRDGPGDRGGVVREDVGEGRRRDVAVLGDDRDDTPARERRADIGDLVLGSGPPPAAVQEHGDRPRLPRGWPVDVGPVLAPGSVGDALVDVHVQRRERVQDREGQADNRVTQVAQHGLGLRRVGVQARL